MATVDQNGKVTAVHAGTAEITASSQADSTIKATSAVTVQGRLSIYDFKAVAGLEGGNYVAMSLEGDTFIFGNYDFDFNAGTTGLGLSPLTSDLVHRVFDLTNIAKPGTLTLQAKGLTSGISSNIVSVTVPEPVVASVSLNKSSADLIMGNTLALTATVLPADAIK